jgi:hypothetical protein
LTALVPRTEGTDRLGLIHIKDKGRQISKAAKKQR